MEEGSEVGISSLSKKALIPASKRTLAIIHGFDVLESRRCFATFC